MDNFIIKRRRRYDVYVWVMYEIDILLLVNEEFMKVNA